MGPISLLLSDMQKNGLRPIDDNICCDGSIHRYSIDGNKSKKDEWYWAVLLSDGNILARYGTWSNPEEFRKDFTSYGETPLSKKIKKEIQKRHQDFIEKLKTERAEASKNARKYWEEAEEKEHAYLKKKQVNSFGTRVLNERLLVPIYEEPSTIGSLQIIYSDGKKKNLPGASCIGFYALGNLQEEKKIYLAEGFATAASIQMSLKKGCAVCCFGLQNMKKIGKKFKKLFPNKELTFCMDEGAELEGLDELGTSIWPKFKDEGSKRDFNDLHVAESIETVREQLKTPSFPFETLNEFMERPKPELTWILEDLIHEGSNNIIHAPTGVGKTNFALEMAWCISAGFRFFRWRSTGARKVCYIEGEMTDQELIPRFRDLYKRYKHPEDEKKSIVPKDDFLKLLTCGFLREKGFPFIDLTKAECRNLLDPLIEDNDVIFLDNFFALTTPCSSNSYGARDASLKQIYDWIREWKYRGKALIVIHHTNKAGDLYGQSFAAADLSENIKLELDEEGDLIINPLKSRNVLPKDKKGPLTIVFDSSIKKAGKWEDKKLYTKKQTKSEE